MSTSPPASPAAAAPPVPAVSPAPRPQYVDIGDPLEIKSCLDVSLVSLFTDSLGFSPDNLYSNIRIAVSVVAIAVALAAYFAFPDLKNKTHIYITGALIVAYFVLNALLSLFLVFVVGNETARFLPYPGVEAALTAAEKERKAAARAAGPSAVAAAADAAADAAAAGAIADACPDTAALKTAVRAAGASLASTKDGLKVRTSLPHYETGYEISFTLGEHTWSQTLQITEFFDTRGVFLPHRFRAAVAAAARNPKRD